MIMPPKTDYAFILTDQAGLSSKMFYTKKNIIARLTSNKEKNRKGISSVKKTADIAIYKTMAASGSVPKAAGYKSLFDVLFQAVVTTAIKPH